MMAWINAYAGLILLGLAALLLAGYLARIIILGSRIRREMMR